MTRLGPAVARAMVGAGVLLAGLAVAPAGHGQEAGKPTIEFTLEQSLREAGEAAAQRDDYRRPPPAPATRPLLPESVRVTVTQGGPVCLPGEDRLTDRPDWRPRRPGRVR